MASFYTSVICSSNPLHSRWRFAVLSTVHNHEQRSSWRNSLPSERNWPVRTYVFLAVVNKENVSPRLAWWHCIFIRLAFCPLSFRVVAASGSGSLVLPSVVRLVVGSP